MKPLEGKELERALEDLNAAIGVPVLLKSNLAPEYALDCLDEVVETLLQARYPGKKILDSDENIIEDLLSERDFIRDTLEAASGFPY